MRGQRLELVRRGGEFHAGDGGDALGHLFGKADRRVEAGADGGAALRQFHQHRQVISMRAMPFSTCWHSRRIPGPA
jgi:hypothetical protein